MKKKQKYIRMVKMCIRDSKEELQKELKDHNDDDMDEYLYDSLKDNDYLV